VWLFGLNDRTVGTPGTPDLMPDHMVRLSCSWALLQITNRLSNCSAEHRQALVSSGHQKLDQRASGCLTSVEKPRRFDVTTLPDPDAASDFSPSNWRVQTFGKFQDGEPRQTDRR
jgi:hypothetical protein